LVCFILRWGVSSVPFLSVHFKATFQSGANSAMASATACGSMLPVWRDLPACHIMGNARHAWFVLFHAGG
jgi:hypothetical protein